MRWSFHLQQSRLAQRLLLVFFGAVLVPVLTLSAVSYFQVRDQLVQLSQQRLERDAKAATQSILERLSLAQGLAGGLTAEEAARSLATEPAIGELRPLTGMVWTDQDGAVRHTVGTWSGTPNADSALQERLTVGPSLVLDSERRNVVLVRAAEGGVLWTSIDTTFLWSSVTDLAQLRGDSRTCIVAAGELLRCDPGFTGSSLAPHLDSRAAFDLDIRGVPHQAVVRPVFLDWAFGTEPWYVVVAEPLSAAIGPLLGFRRAFLPVSLLGILVVLFVSSLQLRRIFLRLRQLQLATARVAGGNYSERIAVEGGDEITELSESFDRMSTEIGRHFAVLRAVNEVDRAALEAGAVAELCERVTAGIESAFPESMRIVVLAESTTASGGWSAVASWADLDKEPLAVAVEIPEQSVRAIAKSPDQGRLPMARFKELLPMGVGPGTLPDYVAFFPLRLEGEPAGFLAVTCPGDAGCAEDRERMRQLADQLAVALSNVRRLEQLGRLNWGALTALARTVDAASKWTAGHSERVADYSVRLAAELGLGERALERIRRGGLLHDIGKLGVSAHVLDKPDRLTDEEFAEMQTHVTIGATILEPLDSFADILPLVLHHHERFDGRGYPAGLAGSGIPYEARIMGVADTFDALTSDRPYRKGLPLETALRIIREEAGSQFDADVALAFVAMMEREAGVAAQSSVEALPDSASTGSLSVEREEPELVLDAGVPA